MKCLTFFLRLALVLFLLLSSAATFAQDVLLEGHLWGGTMVGESLSRSFALFQCLPQQAYCPGWSKVSFKGLTPGDFVINPGNCVGSFTGTCEYTVTFKPMASGGITGSPIPGATLGFRSATLVIEWLGQTYKQNFAGFVVNPSPVATCKVTRELLPVTAPEALPFEEAAPDAPPASLRFDQIDYQLELALIRYELDLFNSYGLRTPRGSGYRPYAYQQHFRDLFEIAYMIKQEIDKDGTQAAACKPLKDKVDQEIKKHKIFVNPNGLPAVDKPSKSTHTVYPARGIDLNGVEEASPANLRKILEVAARNGLSRVYSAKDPVHFQLSGSPVYYNIRGTVESPVDILIIDPKGRKVGFDPVTNAVVNQVGEAAWYSGRSTEPQYIEISDAEAGDYVLTGIGTGNGPFRLTLEKLSEDGAVLESKVISGTVTLGQELKLSLGIPSTVQIDIKPGDSPNSVNLKSRGVIPVAILSSAAFDATKQINPLSLTFGKTGSEQSLAKLPAAQDVNGDGFVDLVCHFHTQSTGFEADSVEGILKGKLVNGIPLQGIDWIRIVP